MGQDNIGIIVLAHGSRRGFTKDECSCTLVPNGNYTCTDDIPWCLECPDTAKGVSELRDMIQDKINNDNVTVMSSFLEFLEPDPFEAVDQLTSAGVNNIVIFPFLLGNGKHATLEMEELKEDLCSKHPEIILNITEGIGADFRLASVIKDRANVVLENSVTNETQGIIIVKAGTKTEYDDCLWLNDLSLEVQKQLNESYVITYAQSHFGLPEIDERTNYLIEQYGVTRITFVPYVFFPGLILQRNIMGSINKYQQLFPDIEFALCPPLGITSELCDIAVDRVSSALQVSFE